MFQESDVCSYYTDKQGNLYQMIGWCPVPTAAIQNIRTEEITHVAYDCLNAESYIKLIPENEVNNGGYKQKED